VSMATADHDAARLRMPVTGRHERERRHVDPDGADQSA
jgi:hypothetical protein